MSKRFSLLCLAGLVAILCTIPSTQAFDRYRDGCQNCHGDFTDDTSPVGTVFPGNDKHQMHRSSTSMNADCDLCHTSGDGRNPFIGSSDGTAINTGLGCVGCHGRSEDAGNDSLSPGLGAGLRQHHHVSGVMSCVNCHSDSDPANYTPVGEDVLPPYYGTADTAVDMPCNPTAEGDVNENWSIGDFLGSDNDGDGFYDGVDPDCAGVPEADCFDEIDNDEDGAVDCADSDCDAATSGACDTGQPGICSAGTRTCDGGAEICAADQQPATEGPPGSESCTDQLDNDCDGATDAGDPDCQALPETDCFDGVDNDEDGAVDCADDDCAGATDGACDTGQPGICSAGTLTCDGGAGVCMADEQPGSEGPAGDATCTDGQDNDCDGRADMEDADCLVVAEVDCFDGIDNDEDGLADCADEDCSGVEGGDCETGEPGVCAAGTQVCLEFQTVCVPGNEGEPESQTAGNCEDGLDNDCDGATDLDDADCLIVAESDCFDGIDNDEDGAVDCADDDCEGALDDACDTGELGVCAAGVYSCVDAMPVCVEQVQAMPEGDMYDNCNDGLDNDCDGATDGDDGDCTLMEADVWLKKIMAHRKVQLKLDQSKRRRVFVQARGDTKQQQATVTLTADFDPDALTVVVMPEQVTRPVGPVVHDDDDRDLTRETGVMTLTGRDDSRNAGRRDDDDEDEGEGEDEDEGEDDDGEDRVTLFMFWPTVTCNQEGSHTIHWTATIDAPENREETGDTLTARTTVSCRPGHGSGRPRGKKSGMQRSQR